MNGQRCWVEVDLDALRSNVAWLRHRIGPAVKLLAVVKADAYGHGLKQIAACLMQSGADGFGVANLAEAHAVRSVGGGWPVLMLGACLPGETDAAVRDGIALTVSSQEELSRLADAAKRLRRNVAIHIKVDTGMGRLGAAPREVVALLRSASEIERIRVEGLYTHFSSAEDDAAFTAAQRRRFQSAIAAVKRAGLPLPMLHACNSAGLLHEPDAIGGMVRPGLLVYGLHPLGGRVRERGALDGLLPALSWKARVGLVRSLPGGATVSYGHTFTTPRRMRVAVVTAGYGDGYSRAGSSRAEVLIGGKRSRVLGRVTMDQMTVDVSSLAEVGAGDEVVLIGRQGSESITAHELAGWFGTIPWEVCTAITYRVPRLYRGATAA